MSSAKTASKPATLKSRILDRIDRSEDQIFLPADFTDLAERPQVLRALSRIVQEERLVRLGRGVYAAATVNPLNDQTMLQVDGGFDMAARRALTRLGIPWRETSAVEDYNAGRSTQIPANTVLVVPKRYRRSIGFRRQAVRYAEK